jgi:hypothetical protein
VSCLRILESWTTDRLHTARSATTTQQFTTAARATTSPIVTLHDGTLATNYSREEINLLVDPIPSLFAAATAMSGAMFSRLWPSLDGPRL